MTLAEVASALGVSPATVSNAFNRPNQLSPSLRQHVLETAARLGYTGPNPAARSLRRGRAGAIGVLYAERLSFAFANPATVFFLDGLALALDEVGLNLLLMSAAPRAEQRLATVNDAVVDGFILHAMPDDDPLVRAVIARALPVVAVDQPRPPGVPFVGIEDEAGAAAAAAYLVGLGHRRVAVITFHLTPGASDGYVDPQAQVTSPYLVQRARLRGFARAFAAAGVEREALPVWQCAEHTPFAGRSAAERLLARTPRPTALLAASDQLALGAMDAAFHLGLRVPEDLSVVGFDDIPAAALAVPELTTVRQPLVEKGRLAARLLIAQLRGESAPQPALLPTELVVRHSAALPSS